MNTFLCYEFTSIMLLTNSKTTSIENNIENNIMQKTRIKIRLYCSTTTLTLITVLIASRSLSKIVLKWYFKSNHID